MKVFVVFMALMAGIGLSASGAELRHRWGFNGDFSDSAGGATALKGGTYVSLYGNRVHMGYGGCTHGSGHVNLGTNRLDTTAATIEIWARHDGAQKWARFFDYGADDKHYFFVGWTYAADPARERVEFYNSANADKTYKDNSLGKYEIGVDYHIAVTFRNNGDGTTEIRWQRRDARTGSLQGSGAMTAENGLHTFADPVLYLGRSQYASDDDAMAAYDEVRIWNGVLSEAQLAASAAAGPDATISFEGGNPAFVPASAPEPPAQRAALADGGVRLMTYNIQYCYDEIGTIVPDRTAARILAENPDFCCVNEVRDSEGHPEATLLAKLTGMHKSFGGSGDGSNGNLILSKEAPLSTETVFLKMSTAGWGDRYCVISEFANFCVAAVHLDTARDSSGDDAVQASNKVAIAAIRAAFAKYEKPVFLCGDWNTRPDWANMADINAFLDVISPTNGVRTYHGKNPSGGFVLDYISVEKEHKDAFYVQRSFVVDDIVTSDHNPVIAEVYQVPTKLKWIEERAVTPGRTGAWTKPLDYGRETMRAEMSGENVFVPHAASSGTSVTMSVTAAFDFVPVEHNVPAAGAQGAVWIGTNGCFQIWTRLRQALGGQAENGWVDVEAEGVTPRRGVDYTFRFVFDYVARTYSAKVATGSSGFSGLAEKGNAARTDFPLAAASESISSVRFNGDGTFTSMYGEYVVVEGFAADEAILLKDNAEVVLDAAKAVWLNSCAGDRAAIGNAAAGLSAKEFTDAYLLNLDITDGERSYAFEITGIEVGSENVSVSVKLTRIGNLAQSINGVLKFYGAATLAAFSDSALEPLSSEAVSNDNFANGDTATITYPKVSGSTTNTFFKAKIEER